MEKNYPSQLTPTQRRDWNAAHILYANNIYATLVGPPVAAFYGSNVLWPQVPIIVHDPAFEDACKILRANGFKDLMDYDYQTLQPPELDTEGEDAVKWRAFSPIEPSGGRVILAPATHWHFNITKDTTIIIDGFRLPKYDSYLQALVSLIAHRSKSNIAAGYFKLQTSDAWVLRHRYHDALQNISQADRFFLERYSSLRRIYNRRKIVELRDGLKLGVMTIDEAVALAPSERYLTAGKLRSSRVI